MWDGIHPVDIDAHPDSSRVRSQEYSRNGDDWVVRHEFQS